MTSPLTGVTLERDEELDRVAAALDHAAGGGGRLMVVEGPPGIGKSRLLEDALALARVRGMASMRAVGEEVEQALPWGVVRQLVERSVLGRTREERRAAMEGPPGEALRALDRAGADGDEAAVARTLHALWWVVADLAEDGPLLVTVDDAQWADPPSLRFVDYLARRLDDLPIALLVGTRPPQAQDGLLARLTAGRLGERLVLRPLTPDAIAELAGERAAREVVAALHEASGGNPFLARQLMDELEDTDRALDDPRTAQAIRGLGPRTISRALLARLPEDAVALARATAVLGMRAAPELAARLAQVEDAGAAEEQLVRGHVLLPGEGELVLAHPVVREAVLRDASALELARLHADAARTLHASGTSPERVAVHLVAAPPGTLPDAAHLLRRAARTLLAEGDAGTAAAHLERALQETPEDADVVAELGFALLRAGDPGAARERLRAAARAAASPRDQALRLAGAASATLELEGPAAAAAELRAVVDDFDGQAALVLEARLAIISSFVPEEFERSGVRLRRFIGLAGDTPEERAVLASVVQRGFSEVRPAPVVLELAEAAAHDGALLADSGVAAVAWGSAMHAAVFADGIDLARRELDRARSRLSQGGSPEEFALVTTLAGLVAWRTGDLARTEADLGSVLETLALVDPTPVAEGLRAVATRYGVHAALRRGDLGRAQALLAAYGPQPEPGTVPANRVLSARAATALAAGDPATARRHALDLGGRERAAGGDNPAIAWRAMAALATARLGDGPEAARLAAEQLHLARRWEAPSDVGAALRLTARVAPRERLERLDESIAVLERAPWRLELAAALCDRGEALRVAGHRSAAREPLHRAAELAEHCGAHALRRRAAEALAALGDRPRELMFSGVESLTASERRVAELAAGGRSNREIAQELFVTPKTVENHLGRVYVKLGVRGRRELTAALV